MGIYGEKQQMNNIYAASEANARESSNISHAISVPLKCQVQSARYCDATNGTVTALR